MFDETESKVIVRVLSISSIVAAMCFGLAACGGEGDRTSGANAIEQTASNAELQVGVGDRIDAQEQRAVLSSVTASAGGTTDGVRSDVATFIVSLAVADTQRAVLHQAARALQATLTVELTRRVDLQAVVNTLVQAKACLLVHFTDGEAAWGALQARTYDTLLRRARYVAFLVASRLLAQRPAASTCSSAPPPPPPPPSPPSDPPPSPPSAGQQLGAEIARLEQQGVLPTLDRGTDIRGPDANANGVRDDVEAYIAGLSLTDAQRKAALQTARNQQAKLLVDPTDPEAVAALSRQSIAATKCMGDVFEPERRRSYEFSERIEALVANTPERAKRYLRYMTALSGTSVAYPVGPTCED